METIKRIKNQFSTINNYAYLDRIGEGGYGLVFKAEQLSTGQVVAIKTIKFKEGISEQKKNQQLSRFERETKLCTEINHPNIVQLLDKGYSDNGEPYAVFEYIDGETLKEFILRNNGLIASEMAALMIQVLDALVCAHAKGIVHRDLKPHNIMVSKLGSKYHTKILDFGIGAFTHDFRSVDYQSLTVTQDVLGTPTYSAPEQLRGEAPTVKSDLYAWGLIVIECLTGKPVMDGGSIAEVFQQQLMPSNVPIPPAIVGHDLGNLLRRVLEKNPRNRAGDVESVFKEFEKINFNTLTGDIAIQRKSVTNFEDVTVGNDMVWSGISGARKQLTILCLKLSLEIANDVHLDLEILDTIQKDQLNLCKDTAIRYGGHVSGAFMNNLAVYFGYPESNDTDARRAGRTALELITEVKKRSTLMLEQHGVALSIQIGLHTGTVLVKRNHTPEGNVPNIAFDLVYKATPGNALVSASSKKLLEQFLEFEKVELTDNSNTKASLKTFKLVGERQTEALSSLRPWSANREMIGRDDEKTELLKLWDFASDKGNAIIINGQAGIGKSKLTYEIKKEVRSVGGMVRECRCLPEHQNNALYPFFNMLRNHWGIVGIEDEKMVLEKVKYVLENTGCKEEGSFSLLCSWLSISLPKGYAIKQVTPEEQKKLLFKILKQCILEIDREKSFLLIIEDLHWLDPTSTEFIQYLLSDLEDNPYFLVMTTRPVFENPWKYDCLSQINLETLPKNAIQLLVEGVLGGDSISDKTLNYIEERADGIPLFIEELTSMLLEQNYIQLENSIYELVENSEDLIPMTLQDLLNARLDRLSVAKETAQLAAAIGREFSYELLIKSTSKDEATVQNDLNLLINADLIYRQRRVQEENYIFRHALIRDVAYDGMTNANKKNSHKMIARSLETNFLSIVNNEPSLLAYHWSSAQNYENASYYGNITTFNSLERSLYSECIKQAQKTISWTKKIENDTLKIERELQTNEYLVQALMAIKGFAHDEVKIINDRSEELSLLLPNGSEWLLNILWTRIQFNLMAANYSKYEILWERAKKDAVELNHKVLLCVLYGINGYKKWLFGEYDYAEKQALKSIEIYDGLEGAGTRESFGIDYKVYSFMVLANVYAFKGDFYKSEEYGNRGIKMMEILNDAHTKAFGLSLYISLYFYRNEIKRIEQIYENNVGFLRKHKFTSFLYLFDSLKGLLNINFNESKINRDLIDSTGIKAAGTYYSLVVAQTAYNCKEYKKSLDIIEEALNEGNITGEKFQFADLYRIKAMCLANTSSAEINESDEYFNKALDFAEESRAILYQLRTLIDCYETTKNSQLKNRCHKKMEVLLPKNNEQIMTKELKRIQEIIL